MQARLGLDTFYEMFKLNRTPYFDKSVSSATLKGYFGQQLFQIIDKINVETIDEKRQMDINEPKLTNDEEEYVNRGGVGVRLRLDWSENDIAHKSDDSTHDSDKVKSNPIPSDAKAERNKTKEEQEHDKMVSKELDSKALIAKYFMDPIKSKTYIVPISAKINFEKNVKKKTRRQKPIFEKEMTKEERQRIYEQKISVIQSMWRLLQNQRDRVIMTIARKVPVVKIFVKNRRFDRVMVNMIILYDRFERFILINFTLDTEKSTLFYKSRIGIKPVMDYMYGEMDASRINTKSTEFFRTILPSIGKTVAENLEIYISSEQGSGFRCRLDLGLSVQMDLKEREKVVDKKKNEGADITAEAKYMNILKTIISLQRRRKSLAFVRKMKVEMKLDKREKDNIKKYGQLVLMTFKKIDTGYYRIWVYEKEEFEKPYYNFKIVPLIQKSQKVIEFLQYRVEDNKLLNCHGLQLLDYLMSVLSIEVSNEVRKDSSDKFIFNIPAEPNFVKVSDKLPNFIAEEEDAGEYGEDDAYPNRKQSQKGDEDKGLDTFDTVGYFSTSDQRKCTEGCDHRRQGGHL